MPESKDLGQSVDDLIEEGRERFCAAVVRKEKLMPIAGKGSVIFPPTFAGEQGEEVKPDYVIDSTPDGDIVLLDSVESQANRIEKLFMPPDGPYRNLVPQIEISVRNKDKDTTINLIEAPHRIADALVRFSDLKERAGKALMQVEQKNDYTEIARISPFSLLFGTWDSRGISGGRVKIPRAFASTVRGYNTYRLHRGYAYTPAVRLYMGQDEVEEALEQTGNRGLSKVGMAQVPGTVAQGGVIVKGDIVRESILSFVSLRNIRATNEEDTKRLRRYIASLGLLCLVSPLPAEYRSGCALVPEPGGETFEVVFSDGSRQPASLSLDKARQLAEEASRTFLDQGLQKQTYRFSWEEAKKEVRKKGKNEGTE
ncbi:MAG: type I-U CRISPR-associated protein Cas7 [Nitrososphaerota archaeon]|jgi:CRISPR-associated protein Csb1|nr:type I-U CRISPR-associated protein Cas7 [Nitrososphaerota archaeon]